MFIEVEEMLVNTQHIKCVIRSNEWKGSSVLRMMDGSAITVDKSVEEMKKLLTPDEPVVGISNEVKFGEAEIIEGMKALPNWQLYAIARDSHNSPTIRDAAHEHIALKQGSAHDGSLSSVASVASSDDDGLPVHLKGTSRDPRMHK